MGVGTTRIGHYPTNQSPSRFPFVDEDRAYISDTWKKCLSVTSLQLQEEHTLLPLKLLDGEV